MTLPGRPVGGIGVRFRGLSKVRIVDFSKLLPGPYATQVLSDMGCRVTRVELPRFGDPLRRLDPALFRMLNEGKRELSIDLRASAGLRRARALVAKSDVLVEGFRPGLMDRLGLGFAALRRLNSRLVYCSIAAGPKAAHDLNFQAESGLLGLRPPRDGADFPALQVADLAASMAAVSGILAALLERQATGRGRRVQVPIAGALHSWLAVPLARLWQTGSDPGRERHWWNGASPFYRLYRCADGRWAAVAALEPLFQSALLRALGVSDAAQIERAFAARPWPEWSRVFAKADACVSPALTLTEAARSRSAGPWPAPPRTSAERPPARRPRPAARPS